MDNQGQHQCGKKGLGARRPCCKLLWAFTRNMNFYKGIMVGSITLEKWSYVGDGVSGL